MKTVTKWILIIVGVFGFSFVQGQVLSNKHVLWINQYRINVELANTSKQRAVGLMHRRVLDKDGGMLFVFDGESTPCFWMKNTPLPLSIAFISAKGQIIQLENMMPLSKKAVCPIGNIRYALEVNQGWFAKRGIKVGDYVKGELLQINDVWLKHH